MPVNEWMISIKDRLPEVNGMKYLIYDRFNGFDILEFFNDKIPGDYMDDYVGPGFYDRVMDEYGNWLGYIRRKDVTHWTSLPKIPEMKGE